MKIYDSKDIRNVCLVGHGGSGKTSLVETMLFNAGQTNRAGKVNDGNTVSDYLQEEIQRHLSISATVIPVEHAGVKINVLDTPGYSDFIGEVLSALRVVETGIMLLSAVDGVEVQAEIIWDIMEEKQLPRIVFINKLDRENARPAQVLDDLRAMYPGVRFAQMQIPVGQEDSFSGVINILGDIPAEHQDEAEILRETLAESVAEADDALLEKYLEGERLTEAELVQATGKALAARMVVPVLFGSVEKNIGVRELAQFIADKVQAPQPAAEKSALVFKTLADPFLGKMTFFRVYGGSFTSDAPIYNATRETEEKVGQLFYLRGKTQDNTPKVQPGDICVVAKLQETKTGDSLSAKDKPVILPGIDFPEPTLPVYVRPKNKGDEDKVGASLARLADEDPTIRISKNTETKQLILTGIGEMQLDVVSEKLLRKFGVAVEMETPRVPYRETIRKAVKEVQGKHKKQSGGHGQYGDVWIHMEPNPGVEFEFKEKIFGGSVPRNFFPAVEKGLREAVAEGFLAGYPMTGVSFTLYDGSYHSVDSSEMAFKLAAIMAFKKGIEQANPVLLEPIVEVEIKTPDTFTGDVIGDLNTKRGRVLGMEPQGKSQVIKAQAPQSEMMRYSIDLKSITQGRGSFTSKFLGYEEMPAKLCEDLVKKLKALQEK
ncbi:MAG: elongation factor G [Gracilibacteraceae bacterium]|nr:elongation factor G [Gracilibacteraceae bacterium]